MQNQKTLNNLFWHIKGNAKKICTNCGKETNILESIHNKTHIWKYWGFCDHCNAPQFEYKKEE